MQYAFNRCERFECNNGYDIGCDIYDLSDIYSDIILRATVALLSVLLNIGHPTSTGDIQKSLQKAGSV